MCCIGGSTEAIVAPPTVGTLPSGQRKLDHILERDSPLYMLWYVREKE